MENRVLAGLEPQSVFHFFEELCQLPHESHNTKAASDWAEAFAKERNLKYRRDEAGNVVIWKDGTPGYENHPAVILQGHLDMVCVKENDIEHDFSKDPLNLYIEDGCVKARGTTLGGDNGIAIAMALAVLDSNEIPHPPVEAMFTVDEEVGLLGAVALDCSDLKGRMLVNIDSEEEGVLTVSCAGGCRSDISRSYSTAEASGTLCTLTVSGLQGGHSGMEINKGLANGNKVLAECLLKLAKATKLQLSYIFGGMQDNAIPKESTAKFVMPEADVQAAAALIEELQNTFKATYAATEPGLTIALTHESGTCATLSLEDSTAFIQMVVDYPNGVQAMSQDIEGLVQTSLNLGILRLENGECLLSSSVRSSVGSEKAVLLDRLDALAKANAAVFTKRGEYPAWEYRKDSPLRDTMVQVFREQYGKEPVVAAIHAGLECGILADKLPGLDAVSIGPDLWDVHSTRERMSIASIERVWKYLLGVLKAL